MASKKFAATLLALSLLVLAGGSASAVEAGLFAGGDIAVNNDLSACASVEFDEATTFVGSYTAVGEVQGPGTQAATIRHSEPIVVKNSATWVGCSPGAYEGATAGEAKFILHVHGLSGGDYVNVKQCTVNFGTVTCV